MTPIVNWEGCYHIVLVGLHIANVYSVSLCLSFLFSASRRRHDLLKISHPWNLVQRTCVVSAKHWAGKTWCTTAKIWSINCYLNSQATELNELNPHRMAFTFPLIRVVDFQIIIISCSSGTLKIRQYFSVRWKKGRRSQMLSVHWCWNLYSLTTLWFSWAHKDNFVDC